MHSNSILTFANFGAPHIQDGTRVLEIGPDGHPSTYRKYVEGELNRKPAAWHTLDIGFHEDLTYPNSLPYNFNIPDSTYDVVLSGSVMEHVVRPWKWMPELARVTKPGGVVITVVPVSWPYHEAPVDCWRVYPDGMNALMEDAGLDLVSCGWGTFEVRWAKRTIPGKSLQYQTKWWYYFYNIAGRLGFPVMCAFDTIGVGRKH